jgi:two-component system, response regulator PdtaR
MPNHAGKDVYHRILETLNSLSQSLITNGSPDGMLGAILSAGTSLLPVVVCSLWRSDDSQAPDVLRLEAVREADGRRSFPRTLKLPGSISRCALKARRFQMVLDLSAEPASAEKTIASQRGLISLLCVPVTGDGPDPVGVLNYFTDNRYSFSDMDIQVAEALARQAGIAWHMAALRGDARRLREELKTRKQVDRAKEILMDRRDMTAEDAYRWIQKRSMDSRRSMRDVADTIILSEVSGHYTSIPHALDLLTKPPRK